MTLRRLLIFCFLSNLLLHLAGLLILPAEIAIHFGQGGLPDSWASKYSNTVLFIIIDALLFLLFYYAPSLTLKTPGKYLNLPNKAYWLRPENQRELANRIRMLFAEFGVAMFIFLFCIGLLALQANLITPPRLNEKLFFPLLVLFLLYTAYWCYRSISQFKQPTD